MPEKRKSNGKVKPEKVIQVGECQAHVRQAVSNAGFKYRYFELVRQWETTTGKRQTGSSFFANHQKDLADCVRQAAAYITQTERTALTES